ncbi:unnamed protein product [Closterium sp. NIES-64]|nr:unnamed protein product [Closterium sp. NIES-64]
MVPGLPQIDLLLPGVPDLPIPKIPSRPDGLNGTMPADNMTLATPDFNMTMPNMTMPGINITTPDFNWTFPNLSTSMPNVNPVTFNLLLAALSAVFSGDGTPASLAALAKERPEALQALWDLLAHYVATMAVLNVAAIAAQFSAAGDAGNLTTPPAERALISKGVSLGYDRTVYFPNGTAVAANGTVIFDPATSPVAVDSEGNTFFANGTVVSANGTVESANGTVATNDTAIPIDGPGLPVPPTISSPPNGDGSVAPPVTSMPAPADVPLASTMPAPIDVPPATNMPAPVYVSPATAMPIVLVELIPRVMGGWGDWGNLGNWSAEEQQQWCGNVTELMNGVVPGLNVTASEYLAWLNASSLAWAAGFDAMWEQAGSDMNVARVVRADVMDSDGIVVHGVDGVLFPLFRDLPVLKGGAGGGGEGDVPMPIAVPVVALGGAANDSARDTGTNGTTNGGKPNGSVATGAGAAAGSSNSSSGGKDAFKIAASGTPAPPAGSPPPSKSQSKAAAGPILLAVALSLVALL